MPQTLKAPVFWKSDVPHIFRSPGNTGFSFSVPMTNIASSDAVAAADNVNYAALAADDVVEVISDNAADTMTYYIVYVDANNQYKSEVGILNGTTAVEINSSSNVSHVIHFAIDSKPTGTVEARRKTGSTTIMQIPSGQLAAFVCHWPGLVLNKSQSQQEAVRVNQSEVFVTSFGLRVHSPQGDVTVELREYPDLSGIRDLTDGYALRGTIETVASENIDTVFVKPTQPIMLNQRSYMAIVVNGDDSTDGVVTVEGYTRG